MSSRQRCIHCGAGRALKVAYNHQELIPLFGQPGAHKRICAQMRAYGNHAVTMRKRFFKMFFARDADGLH